MGVAQQGVQPRPPRLGAGNPDIRILMDNFIPPVCGQLAKLVKLGLDVLVRGADPRIDCGFCIRAAPLCPKLDPDPSSAALWLPAGLDSLRGGLKETQSLPPIYYLAEMGLSVTI